MDAVKRVCPFVDGAAVETEVLVVLSTLDVDALVLGVVVDVIGLVVVLVLDTDILANGNPPVQS